jgi:hypothetical protein
VPENGISPASNYGEAVAWQAISRCRQLRIRPPVPFEALAWSNLAGSSRMRRNGLTGSPVAGSALCAFSGRVERPLACSEHKVATRKLEEAWAVLDFGDLH